MLGEGNVFSPYYFFYIAVIHVYTCLQFKQLSSFRKDILRCYIHPRWISLVLYMISVDLRRWGVLNKSKTLPADSASPPTFKTLANIFKKSKYFHFLLSKHCQIFNNTCKVYPNIFTSSFQNIVKYLEIFGQYFQIFLPPPFKIFSALST